MPTFDRAKAEASLKSYKQIKRKLVRWEDSFVEKYLIEHSTDIAFATYAFVFGYYGFLKIQALVTGLSTPVRGEVGHLVTVLNLPQIGITVGMAMAFIGAFEMFIGSLFAFKKIRLVLPLFLIHMVGTFVSLAIARGFYFKEPFLMGVPWLFDTFAAYILKNTIFVGGFLVLAAVELSHRKPQPSTDAATTNAA